LKGRGRRAESKGRRAKGGEQRAKGRGRRAKGGGRRAKGGEMWEKIMYKVELTSIKKNLILRS